MKVTEHQGKSLKYLAVEPDGYGAAGQHPMVVLLHGYGAHMGDLAGLCSVIEPVRYVYICPNAPISLRSGQSTIGYAWAMPGDDGTQEDSDAIEEMLTTLIEEVTDRYGVEPGRAVVGGFSQGGMLSYRSGLTNPQVFGGLAALSARIKDVDGLRSRLPAGRDQAIFIAHGVTDTMIPVQHARETRRFLEEEGYKPEYREYPMGHEINQNVLDDLVPWLHGVLSPDRSGTG